MKIKLLISLTVILSIGNLTSQKLFKDIKTGSGSSFPNYLGNMPNGSLLVATKDSFGREIWFSDGTVSGTRMLADANKGFNNSTINEYFADSSFTLLFIQNESNQIWATDGTAQGTKKLATISNNLPYVSSDMVVKYHNKIYFSATDSYGNDIMITDGTPGGTKGVIDMGPGSNSGPFYFAVCNDKMYFFYEDSIGKTGLYESNGTKSGTRELLSMISYNSRILVQGDYLYYIGYSNSGIYKLYRFNTNTQTQEILYEDANDRILSDFFFFDQKLYFNTDNKGRLRSWFSDGTPNGHRELTFSDSSIHSIQLKSAYKYPNYTIALVYTENYGTEYWKLENNGTHLKFISDIAPGNSGSIIYNQVPIYKDGKIYFIANSPQYGNAIWYSDATTQNTKVYFKVKSNQHISSLYKIKNQTIMSAFLDNAYGEEMYIFEELNTSIPTAASVSNSIYPNPIKAGEVLYMDLEESETVQLYGMDGKMIVDIITDSEFILPEDLTPGTYFIKIGNTGKQTFYKLIIE